jgi:phosphotransferase system HPr (HPr) family protein
VTEREVVILNTRGLHARAAARFVQMASGFRSRIQVLRDSQTADGKSILGLLALLARPGMRLTIRADGTDEHEAVGALAALVAGGFEERT